MSRAAHERRIESYHRDLIVVQNQAEDAERRERRSVGEWQTRYDALLEKYHALRITTGANPAPAQESLIPDEPDLPPPEVLEAIQRISPVRDRTYEANWAHWEANKLRAAQDPKDFADEIMLGAVFAADDIIRHGN